MIRGGWKGDVAAVTRRLRAVLLRRLRRAVALLHTETRRALNTSNPRPYVTPSLPGQAPRLRTGWLRDNVFFAVDEKALTGRVGVGVNADYGLALELGTRRMAARPFLAATARRLRKELFRILGEG